MRRSLLLLNVVCLFSAWLFASQIWASAVLVETLIEVKITGIEAYPQAVIVLVIWALISIFAKYFNSFFSKFIFTAVTVLLFATISPMWFDSAAGSLYVLKPKITKLTGIADLSESMDQIASSFYNHMAADLFVIFIVIGLATTVFRIWFSAASSPTEGALTTRIDNLPKW